ncbi:MAG TPA: HEAT repeat domain-containing protein, partial [Polyangiaceae bacterium]|nr:HEAT repeat domain-containing protein [Polyangiaceae bacterium]
VAVSLITLDIDPKLVGQVMAHEGGHYLGLMHTTERDGTLFDLLPDTPECDADTFDANGSSSVEVEECGLTGGASNLMFWSADATPEQVTASQSFVLLRNPIVDTSGAAAPKSASSPAVAGRPASASAASPAAAGATSSTPADAALSTEAPAAPLASIAAPAAGDPSLRSRLARAFGGYETLPDKATLERLADAARLVPALVELAADPSERPHKRANALASLRFFAADAGARAELFARAGDASAPAWLRRAAALAAASAYGDEALSALGPLLGHADARLRQAAVRALGASGSARSRELLAQRAAVEGDANVKLALRRALPPHK